MTSKTVLYFPHVLAEMRIPREMGIPLKPVTAISLPTMMMTIQKGFPCRNEGDERSDDQEFVCEGIEEFPRVATIPRRLARYPSNVSVIAAAKKRSAVIKWVKFPGEKRHDKDKRDGDHPDDRHPIGQSQDLFTIELFHLFISDCKLSQMAHCTCLP